MADDSSFGPQWASFFDFTISFENWIFTVLPAAIIIAVTPLYVVRYLRRPVICRFDALFWGKLFAASALFVIDIVLAAVWSRSSDFPPSSIVAVCLLCVGALGTAAVILLGHRHAIQSSAMLSIYLTITFLVNLARPRSFFMRDSTLHAAGALSIVDCIIRLGMVVLEEMPKSLILVDESTKGEICKESTAGFWNRTLLVWIFPTLLLGYRKSLKMKDLMGLGPEFSSKRLSEKFEPKWAAADKSKPNCLLRTSLKSLFLECVVPIAPRLVWSAFNFTTPWLLRRVIAYIRDRRFGTAEEGGGLIGAGAFVYLGLMIAKTCTTHFTIIAQVKMRGLLISRILRKNIFLRHSTAKESAAVTLMSADVDGIVESTKEMYDVIAAPIEVGVAFYLLWREIGPAFFLPIVTVIVMLSSSHFLAIRLRATSAIWNKSIEARVTAMSKVLAQTKAIKINGLERVISKYMQSLRKIEIKRSIAVRTVTVIMTALIPVHFALTPTLVVAGALFWTTWKDGLDPVTVFPTLVLVGLLSKPLNNILMNWPLLGSVVAYFKRIEDFILLPERSDPRNLQPTNPASTEASSEKALVLQQTVSTSQDDEKASTAPQPLNDNVIVLKGVSVAAEANSDAILTNVNLIVQRLALTMLVGPVGCGKSFLLRTILGETILINGSITVDQTAIAYCDQNIWLPNTTIKKAIIGESSYDGTWYAKIVSVCLLDYDIESLPNGDQTNIGSNGALLSGGQKQRLALARALYTRARIYLLDDIFSALDRKTARAIFNNLFSSDGILGQGSGTTTVLATHSVEFLSKADKVAVFDAKKALITQETDATIEQLRDRGLLVEEDEEDEPVANEVNSEKLAALADAEARVIEEKESTEHFAGDFSLYTFFLRPAPRVLLSLFFVLVAMAAFIECAIPIFMRAWTEVSPKDKYWFIGLVFLGFGAMALNGLTAGLFQLRVMPVLSLSFHDQFLDAILHAKVAFLTATNNGALLNRASQDMTLVSQVLPKMFFLCCYGTFVLLGTTIIILSATTYTIVVIPFMVLVMYLLQAFYLGTSRQMRFLDLEGKTPLYSKLTETISGLEHIRAFGWEERTLDESLRLLDHSQKSVLYMLTIQRWLLLVLDTTTAVVAIALVAFASFWTKTASQSSIGVGMLGLMEWNENCANWVDYYTMLETSLGAAQRLRTFIAQTPMEKDTATVDVLNWPTEGKVELANVTAQYDIESEHKALNNVSMTVLPGQKVGITGRTGSGKSSLILTLLNMIDYTGQVIIDGVDISNIPRRQLRQAITTISQDQVDLAGTVRDNMFPREDDVDESRLKEYDEEMKAILIKVELWSKIADKKGLDTALEDLELSQGQKQLFSLARAMMHKSATNSKIVFIDEATSNIDHESDARLQVIMNETFQGCTRLVIAHRLQTIQDASSLFEFSNGQLINTTVRDATQSNTEE